MQVADLTNKIVNYSAAGPKNGQIMFYAENRTGGLQNIAPTANGYGYWYNGNGAAVSWTNGYTFAEFAPASLTFSIGQNPGKNSNGTNRTIRQALVYKKSDTETAKASFIFNIHFNANKTDAELTKIEYENTSTDISNIESVDKQSEKTLNVYNLTGQCLKRNVHVSNATASLPAGIYIVGNKKVVVR